MTKSHAAAVQRDEFSRAPRAPVFLMARVEGAHGAADVKLRNISAGGALVEGDHLPSLDSAVTFIRNELSASGTIVWRNGRFAGIRFNGTIETSNILRTIGRAVKVTEDPEEYRRPGFRVRQMSKAELEWARQFAMEPPLSSSHSE